MINPEKLNQNLIGAIKEKISGENGHSNLANNLMDILFIGKEAIYRRLRSEVPFTFAEAAFIAKKLGISLDSIAGSSIAQNISFELIPTRYSDPKESDYYRLEEYLSVLKTARGWEESELVHASTLFPQFPGFRHYYLTKFYSFKWSYMHNDIENVRPYHEADIPDKIIEIRKKIIEETLTIKSTCYIWDVGIFSSIVNDMKFFNDIGYLRNEDITPIKDELMIFINELEDIASKGMFKTGNKVQIYVSNTNFDTIYNYVSTPKFKISMIGAFGLNYVSSLDPVSFEKMKSWIQSLKKLSTLISVSGEIQRAHFFKRQREFVNSL